MRTEQRERIVPSYDTIYIAEDGTEFKDKDECEKYEKTAEAVIRGAVAKLNRGSVDYADDYLKVFGCEETVYAIEIGNADDLLAFNMFLQHMRAMCCLSATKVELPIGSEAIGKTVYYGLDNGDDYYYYGDREVFAKYLHNRVDEFFESIDKEYKERTEKNEQEGK